MLPSTHVRADLPCQARKTRKSTIGELLYCTITVIAERLMSHHQGTTGP
jgi:hypothetical protein